METKKLPIQHIRIQFLMLFFTLFSFFLLTLFSNNILIWLPELPFHINLFSTFVSLIISLLSIFFYIKNRKEKTYLIISLTFFLTTILDLTLIILERDFFNSNLHLRLEESPTYLFFVSRFVLSLGFFIHFLLQKRKALKIDKNIKNERKIIVILFSITILFFSLLSILDIPKEFLLFGLLGVSNILILSISFLGNIFSEKWEYEDIYFWIIFSLSFQILSQIFLLQELNRVEETTWHLFALSGLFSYLAILFGIMNAINNQKMFKLNLRDSKGKRK